MLHVILWRIVAFALWLLLFLLKLSLFEGG